MDRQVSLDSRGLPDKSGRLDSQEHQEHKVRKDRKVRTVKQDRLAPTAQLDLLVHSGRPVFPVTEELLDLLDNWEDQVLQEPEVMLVLREAKDPLVHLVLSDQTDSQETSVTQVASVLSEFKVTLEPRVTQDSLVLRDPLDFLASRDHPEIMEIRALWVNPAAEDLQELQAQQETSELEDLRVQLDRRVLLELQEVVDL